MRVLPVRPAFLVPLLLVVVAACGAPAPMATPTPTHAPTPTPAPALTATPTLTPTPSPTGGPPQDGQTATLLQRAEQVRVEIIEATREGCAFLYEEGEYRSNGSGTVEGNVGGDAPYGRVARTTVRFGPGGQFRGESRP